MSNKLTQIWLALIILAGLCLSFQNCSSSSSGGAFQTLPLSGTSVRLLGDAAGGGGNGNGYDGMSYISYDLDLQTVCSDFDLAKSRIIIEPGSSQYLLVRFNCQNITPPQPITVLSDGLDIIYQGEVFEPEWMQTSRSGLPMGRHAHSALWTGSEMLIWGGLSGNDHQEIIPNVGGAFNPATNTWRLLSTQSAPKGRTSHVAAWTGSQMFVWGGFVPDTGQYFADGGLYDPATDTWSSVTEVGAPTPRAGASAVWTGSQIIVWGGINSNQDKLSDGGIYDPVANSWRSLNSAQAPAGRYGHTGLWTGHSMIVWGGVEDGLSSVSDPGSGGIYDPSMDTWSSLSSSENTSSNRYLHTAVWTGTAMIVWGGKSAFSESRASFSDGASYNPQTNAWTPISSTDNPSARQGHTAVWTGSQMIIWGGTQDLSEGQLKMSPASSVFLYNPSLDNWTRLLPSGITPPARTEHSAIWAGAQMIVWGGDLLFDASDEARNRLDGGILNPAVTPDNP